MLKEIHEQPETAELWVTRHLPQGLPAEQPVALPMDVPCRRRADLIPAVAPAAMLRWWGFPSGTVRRDSHIVHYAVSSAMRRRRWLPTPSPLG